MMTRVKRINLSSVVAATWLLAVLPSAWANEALTKEKSLCNGTNLTGWRAPHGDWQVAGTVSVDPAKPEAFLINPGHGVLVNGTAGRTSNLMTEAEFGDVELHVEFCIPKHSNSGIYLQGRYEIQVYESYGAAKDAHPGIECGGIYARWINEQNVEGHSPRVNASKPAGEWQTFDIQFRAPRFNASGKKTANAQMIRVTHNGQIIHEYIELNGPTRSSHYADEQALGPIQLQGDHGPVAYRNLRVKPLDRKTASATATGEPMITPLPLRMDATTRMTPPIWPAPDSPYKFPPEAMTGAMGRPITHSPALNGRVMKSAPAARADRCPEAESKCGCMAASIR